MNNSLAERRCEVCTPETPTLSRAAIDRLLQQVPGWSVAQPDGHFKLTRAVRFKGFMPGVALVDRIAEIAEQEGHHPDLHLAYGSLVIDLTTHAAGGLTDNDFVMAAKIDRLLPR